MSHSAGSASPRPASQRLMHLAVVGAAALVVAGGVAFYYASKGARQGVAGDAITVTIKDGVCDPNTITVAAGPATFTIVNKSDRALEWEILDGVMVIEERENIAPGISQTLQAKLKPGDYEITCGLLNSPRGTLHVTPSAASDAEAARPALRAYLGPLAEFQVFLVTQANSLVKVTQALDGAIRAGDLEKARQAYQSARTPYKQIEPMADQFADLHNTIDPVADFLERREQDPAFTGFHRIEYGLYTDKRTAGLEPYSAKLLADVTALKDRIRGMRILPEQIARGAQRLVASMAATKVAVGVDHYAQTDLADFDANIAGVSRMMTLLKPVAMTAAPQVVADIEARLTDIDNALKSLRGPDKFPAYDSVNGDSRKALSQKMQALADAIGKFNAAVGLE
ncbi:MAG: iron uptake system protein EfeO [Phyllobacterium sp.]|uniref:iron uptake system protein EfeO n=1 Tax=Phyllobacterium sp. TaxID=1871046 RepID=UPI0030F1F724